MSTALTVDLNLLGWGVAWEKDEEDWSGAAALLHHSSGTEGILVDVLRPHDLLTEVLQRICDAIGTQGPAMRAVSGFLDIQGSKAR